jgi:hypothetical protein
VEYSLCITDNTTDDGLLGRAVGNRTGNLTVMSDVWTHLECGEWNELFTL